MTAKALSADSHIVEPGEVFAGLSDRFGDRAPRIVHEDGRGDFLVIGDRPEPTRGSVEWLIRYGQGIGRLGIAGRRLDNPETHDQIRQGYAGLIQGVLDPAARIQDQDLDGVGLEVLYPTVYFVMFNLEDPNLVTACFRNYNDWLASYCSHASDRLIGLALIPLQDPNEAVIELQRAIKLGFRGGCIPSSMPASRPYHDPAYDRVWALAEEANFPLSLHSFTDAFNGVVGMEGLDAIASYANYATTIQISIIDLICQGVAHRFPNLKFVCTEWNTGWLAHWLERLDHSFYRSRANAPSEIDMQPSEYWKRQFYATFEDDRIGILTRDWIGTNTLMWGSDYPHHDSVWPHSQEVLDRIFDGVPTDVREAMTQGNVSKLYKVPVTA
jgi:predicted TIM-barrel fold metal-dependent hydrolase